MNHWKKFFVSTFLIFSSSAFAIDTTSDVKGSVVDQNGNSISGAEVTVTYEATQSSKTVITDSDGNFYVLNLKAGGPYSISSGASRVSDVFLAIGKTANVRLNVSSVAVEEVVVTATRSNVVETTSGPSFVFTSVDLANAAAYDRDIKEVLAQHPSIYINDGNEKSMQCAGNNSRLNGLTVDGISLNDTFGLNANGYPSERMPFSYDAIDQVAIEFAPYDVQYGGFSACVVNAVTKSGSNTLSGNAFYEFTNDNLTGDQAAGNDVTIPSYDEAKYGFTLGGPVIKDKLYFFTAYEMYDDQDIGEYGYVGSGMPTELAWFSKAQFDQIVDIFKNKYNFDPGGLPSVLDSESEKLLAKFDYYVNDNTRAVFTYNYSEGFTNQPSDASPTEFEFSKHFYKRGNELNAYMVQVFSSIGNINTQFKYGYKELENTQVGLGGKFGDFQINIPGGKVYGGGTDDSRQNNLLSYDTTNMAFIGDYQYGNQLISFGYEYEESNIFNMFMQESIGGEWDFYSLALFDSGTVAFDFQNTATLNPRDASKEWSYEISTLFVQSEMAISDNLDVTFGIRYEEYGVPEGPPENPDFVSTYGYSNATTYDGQSMVMPRMSFSFRLDEDTELYGGYGVFSGGNPAVWFSNAYSNNGISIIDGDGNYSAFTDPMCDPLTGNSSSEGPGYAVPCGAITKVLSGSGGGDTNSLASDFEMPSYRKISFGMNKQMGDYLITFDYMNSKNDDAFIVYNQHNSIIGTAQTGHAIGSSTGGGTCCTGDYVLANSSFTPETTLYSFSLSRSFDNVDVSVGYTHTDAEDVHPMASSVAYTNANENLVAVNPNNPAPARSDWEINDRLVANLNWSISDKTSLSLFWQRASGNPYSLSAYGGWTELGFAPGWRTGDFPSIPLYVSDESFVTYSDAATEEGLKSLGNGLFARNAFTSKTSTRVDMKLTHSLMDDLDMYLVVRNLGNLLETKGFGNFLGGGDGALYQSSSANGVTEASFSSDGSVEYDGYDAPSVNAVIGSASIWNIKVGFDYKF
tara:strand:+ start:6032 stop:9106 length:3075 start_codon:yes stop_codon:yes gene_type:complete